MTADIDPNKFGPLVAVAREAFRMDPSYAIAIAGQASSLHLRRKSRQSSESSSEESFPSAEAV